MGKLKYNISKLYTGSLLSELIFFIPIMIPFFGDLGFSMTEIIILEASFAIMLVLFEIPSGYIADLYGRKKALIIGSLIEIAGLTIFVFSHSFWGFLTGEMILGLGASLVSGAGEALLYDTLLELKMENKYKKIEGNRFFFGRIASILASITGAILASYFLRLPFYATLIPFSLWIILNFTLIEPHRHKSEIETWAHFKNILTDTFHNKKLWYFIIFSAIPPGFFLMTFWLDQRYMEFIDLPIFFFGFIVAGMNLSSGLAGKFAKEIESVLTPKISLIMVPVLSLIAWLILGTVQSVWTILLFFLVTALWGFFLPVLQDFIQKMTTSDRRATVISIRSFMTRLIFFIFAPFLGWITDLYTIQEAFLTTALLMFILGGIGLLLLKTVKVL